MGSWNVVGELVIGYVAEWTHTPFVQVSTANPSFKSSFGPSAAGGSAARTLPPRHAQPSEPRTGHSTRVQPPRYTRRGGSSHTPCLCVYVCACAAAGRQPDHDADGLRLRGAGHPPEESLKRPAHVRAPPSAHQPRYVTRDILLPGAFAAASGIISAASRVHMS